MGGTNSYFIKVYNSLINPNSEIKLSINELFIYCYLYMIRTYENLVITSYDLLSLNNILYKKKNDNKNEIKNCLMSLKEKKIISFEEKDKQLTINFIFEEKEKGHEQVLYQKFRTFTDPRDFYIFVSVSRWSKKGGAKYSYNDWAKLLNCTREHAITIIDNACNREIIYKKAGAYTEEILPQRNQKVQEKNIYSLKPFNEEENIIKESNVNVSVEKTSNVVPFEKSNLISESKEERHNWNSTTDLDVHDFIYYLENFNDENIKEMCEKRINRIQKKNPKFKFVMDKLLNDAKKLIESKLLKQKREEEKSINNKIEKWIKETNDVILQINNKLIPFEEYSPSLMEVEKVYYLEKVDISHYVDIGTAYSYELREKKKPNNLTIYRKVNGDWKERDIIEEAELEIA
jgi:hypothetical protein